MSKGSLNPLLKRQLKTRYEIVPATFRDLTYIAANLREADREEISCLYKDWHPQHVAHAAFFNSLIDCKFVVLRGSQPVAAFGVSPFSAMDPDIWLAWAFGTDAMLRAVPAITRFLRESFIPDLRGRSNVRRIQCFTLSSHDISHGWLKGLGAEFEGTMKSFGRGGEAFDIYAWRK